MCWSCSLCIECVKFSIRCCVSVYSESIIHEFVHIHVWSMMMFTGRTRDDFRFVGFFCVSALCLKWISLSHFVSISTGCSGAVLASEVIYNVEHLSTQKVYKESVVKEKVNKTETSINLLRKSCWNILISSNHDWCQDNQNTRTSISWRSERRKWALDFRGFHDFILQSPWLNDEKLQ